MHKEHCSLETNGLLQETNIFCLHLSHISL